MMKKFLAILSALMLMILAIMPMSASAASTTMYVDSGNGLTVRIHKAPSEGGIICNLGVGFPVRVTGASKNGYTPVSFKLEGAPYSGYIMDKFLSSQDVSSAHQRFTNVKDNFSVVARPSSAHGKVSIWPTASKRGTGIRVMETGESVKVLRASHAWYEVEDGSGTVGYVAKAYVRKA